MWSRTPTALLLSWWLSWSLACLATATAWRLSAMLAPQPSPQPSPQPITQRPSECLRACPQLPLPTDGDELAVALWTFDLIDAAAECRRLHDACRAAH